MTLHPTLESMASMTRDRERRYKGILIDPRHIIFVTMGPRKCEYLSLMYEDIPQDAHVIDVTYEWSHRAFLLTLWHESFDIVPDGERIPFHWPVKVNVLRHLCCQPVQLTHEHLPTCHDALFNAFVRDRRELIRRESECVEAMLAELDSWIKQYEEAYGVRNE